MTARSYDQYCSVAQALDVVGERWSLLIVRELLDGPKRYVELQDGLVSVSTDMLAARLRDLVLQRTPASWLADLVAHAI